MIVALTAKGDELCSALDPRFGRAAFLVLFDTESNRHHVLNNEDAALASNGAGIQTADRVASEGAEAVVTGHVGPKAAQALRAAHIQVFASTNRTVEEAIEAFQRGELEKIGKE